MKFDIPAAVTEAVDELAHKFAHCMLCFTDPEGCQQKGCELWPFRYGFFEFVDSVLPASANTPVMKSGAEDVTGSASCCVPYPLKNGGSMRTGRCESARSLLKHVQKHPMRIR